MNIQNNATILASTMSVNEFASTFFRARMHWMKKLIQRLVYYWERMNICFTNNATDVFKLAKDL